MTLDPDRRWGFDVNYQKIDAALAAAIADVENEDQASFGVFIETNSMLGDGEASLLKKFGVGGVAPDRKVFTANLSAPAIGELSERPWVRFIRLSQRLRPLGK
jgi:hypothetical protein